MFPDRDDLLADQHTKEPEDGAYKFLHDRVQEAFSAFHKATGLTPTAYHRSHG